MSSNYLNHEMFALGEDTAPYRLLTRDHVGTRKVDGREILEVESGGLILLADQAMRDCQHLLRPGHLAQLRKIIDDPETSANDRFVAYELLKNASIAAAGVLPMCQDTGTAIVMGKKGENVWDDEAALSLGILPARHITSCAASAVPPLTLIERLPPIC
jgi:fumarate hydratase class I